MMKLFTYIASKFHRREIDLLRPENKLAYDAGWASEDTGQKNPYMEDSPEYLAWQKGTRDRAEYEMQIW